MEEFDLNDMIGTKVSNLKENADTDIDYDNILDNLKMSETNKCDNGMCGINNRNSMNNFVKNLEKDLDNYQTPQPINYTKNMDPQNRLQDILPREIANVVESSKDYVKKEDNNIISNITSNLTKLLYNEIFIYTLLFILLNNNIIINLINKIPHIIRFDRFQLNLIIRTGLFGIIIYILKNINLLNI
jgi:hypothetical protein